jgi:hypothetical protein
MTDDQIRKLVTPLLRKTLAQSGYRSATVESETDFDGNPILRIVASVTSEDIPAETLLDAQHEIRSLLMGKGDDRFVFLDATHPHEEFVDEDIG